MLIYYITDFAYENPYDQVLKYKKYLGDGNTDCDICYNQLVPDFSMYTIPSVYNSYINLFDSGPGGCSGGTCTTIDVYDKKQPVHG